ncbi:methylmalonyl Co-A mutase-associated GTPase MeaB, partial [bacterium]|nr:methylmalonyl Co-A mutase-associated GTPase MeaB [bacterium]
AIYSHVGRARRIGLTGPPGAGKSTLVQSLALELRSRGQTVGVVAVDPTSPFTGGALLGDRIRMDKVATDPGVFIRSMASRGSLGGLSRKAGEAADVLDVFGRDWILMETVGVGQSEIDIAQAADTTVVVFSPEVGDGVQAMKAGLMEIAEIICVNKADREGADRLVRDLEGALELVAKRTWSPVVVRTVATRNQGTKELLAAIETHRAHLEATGELASRRVRRARNRIREIVEDRLVRRAWTPARRELLDRLAERVVRADLTPYAAADELLR